VLTVAERAVYTAQVYKTEDRVITHIWAMRRAFGAWPGYKRVPGGYVVTYEADPLPLPPVDDDGNDGYDDDEAADELDGPWHDYGWRTDDDASSELSEAA